MKSAWSGEARLPTAEGAERTRAVLVVQRPHILPLICGHGDKILSLAATEADIIGFTGLTWTGSSLAPTGASVDALAERVRFVRDRAGERFDDLELNILTQVTSIGGDTQTTVTKVASTLGTEPDLVRTTPMTLIGSVPEIVDKLVATREQLGISYVVVFDTAIDEMGPVLTQLAGT